jgi:hypothetical protein
VEETCSATKISPTANGDIEVRCVKRPGHVAEGDLKHEAWVQKVFPVRWVDPVASETQGQREPDQQA